MAVRLHLLPPCLHNGHNHSPAAAFLSRTGLSWDTQQHHAHVGSLYLLCGCLFCEGDHHFPRVEASVFFLSVPPPHPKPTSPVVRPRHFYLHSLCAFAAASCLPTPHCCGSFQGLQIICQDCIPGKCNLRRKDL